MNFPYGRWSSVVFLVLGLILSLGNSSAADFGRLLGTVNDPQGNPLMGATVLVVGPSAGGLHGSHHFAERILTDTHGKFTVERLMPGLYSLRVTLPTRLPAIRNGVSVKAGHTTQQSLVLSEIFAPIRFQVPQGNASTWGEDWKWVLRTSATTRPILRYRAGTKPGSQTRASKAPAGPSQRLIGLLPGAPRREVLSGDSSLGSVLAYLRPLSPDSDVLVVGSMTASGLQTSSLATAFRKNLLNGDPQLLSVAVHQLSFSDGIPFSSGEPARSSTRGQGVVVNYAHTHRLSSSLSFTAGFEVDYLNADRDAVMARPTVKVEYQADPTTLVTFRYGALRPEGDGTLVERVGALNAFPRMTLRGYRPRFENVNHAAASVNRELSKSSWVQIAVYQDAFQNAAVLGVGEGGVLEELAGNFIANPVGGGVILSAGNYRSTGFRAVYSRTLGNHLETSFAYALGSALAVKPDAALGDPQRDVASAVRAERSQSFAGKLSARVPVSRTQIVTSYEWQQPGRVTSVDPFGQAALQIQPFLGVLIRQPLPTLAFLPARIEALADFRNLLAQGYATVGRSGDKPLLLTSGYRSFRGGFSVLF